MILPNPQLILIDLDGTLIDTVPDLANAVDGMMSQLCLPHRGEEQVRHWVGNGIERLVKRALLNQLEGEPDDKLYQSAISYFNELYVQCNGEQSVLFPGVREGLDWLKSLNYNLACITNKAGQFTIPLLKALNLYDNFSLVISGDTLPKKKPDPLPLLHAADFFQVEPHHALMIGDSINDVQAARAAGFQILCVSYGYNHGLDIRQAKPDVVIDSLNELSSVFREQ
ncbi:MAG: phosphoglycolate phosphatase [Gammaproteobacteria bacterium]|nr:MAG: phosphoglycolate phosphatase [Gammaproteobacteria bacterium]RKZ42946.1 MAG: phosphoglycolate phosphatase [Gammaproteobacteria bacterium]RKZ76644.1 MAG: phosphoglycolate phosphatase [Gammaproteobacteria bacterium]